MNVARGSSSGAPSDAALRSSGPEGSCYPEVASATVIDAVVVLSTVTEPAVFPAAAPVVALGQQSTEHDNHDAADSVIITNCVVTDAATAAAAAALATTAAVATTAADAADAADADADGVGGRGEAPLPLLLSSSSSSSCPQAADADGAELASATAARWDAAAAQTVDAARALLRNTNHEAEARLKRILLSANPPTLEAPEGPPSMRPSSVRKGKGGVVRSTREETSRSPPSRSAPAQQASAPPPALAGASATLPVRGEESGGVDPCEMLASLELGGLSLAGLERLRAALAAASDRVHIAHYELSKHAVSEPALSSIPPPPPPPPPPPLTPPPTPLAPALTPASHVVASQCSAAATAAAAAAAAAVAGAAQDPQLPHQSRRQRPRKPRRPSSMTAPP